MGMFDSVYVPCPHCQAPVEHQSKAWNCDMDRFSIENAPAEILFDIMNDPTHCEKCDGWMVLIDPKHPPGPRKPPELSVAKVTPPENPRTHFQGMKWWPYDRPFTYSDLEDGTKP